MNRVWENKLDNKYDIMVDSDQPYHGFLIIKDGNKELLKEEVTISYDAKFGPDFADIDCWSDRAIDFIDKMNKT